MNITRLSARNFRTYPDVDVTLPDGHLAIVGSNGSGKSSLLMILDVGLFGPPSRSLTDFVRAGEDEMELLVEFDHAGNAYRVRRQYKRGKVTLDFESFEQHADDDPGWSPLTRESARETQELVERTLGLSRETFCASALLRQGDSAAFTETTPARRKEVLGEVLGLSRYDTLLALAKQDRRAVERDLAQIDGETASARETVAEKEHVTRQLGISRDIAKEATAALAQEDEKVAEVQARCDSARGHASARATAAAELDTALTELGRLDELLDREHTAKNTLAACRLLVDGHATEADVALLEQREQALAALSEDYRAKLADRQAKLQLLRQAEQAVAELERNAEDAAGRAGAARVKLAALEHGHAGDEQACDRCGQLLDGDARDKAATSLLAEIADYDALAQELLGRASRIDMPDAPDAPEPVSSDALATVRLDLAVARKQLVERASAEARVAAAESVLRTTPENLADLLAAAHSDVDAKTAALAALEPVDLASLEQQLDYAKRGVDQERDRLKQADLSVARREERLNRIQEAETQLAAADARTAELRSEIDVLHALERAFGRDGIPALIVESSAIPFLETEASRILTELGTSYQVELRTQAALKSADGVKDTLDVVIVAEDGERPYETFSGGERTRINLALRIALARLLAARRGAESRLLAIDEPEFLDDAGTAALVQVLHGLDEFRTTLLISHAPNLRDAFDQVLEVVKDENGSRLVAGATVEVVA